MATSAGVVGNVLDMTTQLPLDAAVTQCCSDGGLCELMSLDLRRVPPEHPYSANVVRLPARGPTKSQKSANVDFRQHGVQWQLLQRQVTRTESPRHFKRTIHCRPKTSPPMCLTCLGVLVSMEGRCHDTFGEEGRCPPLTNCNRSSSSPVSTDW